METEIRKDKGIDNLVNGYSPRKVEEEKRMIHVERDLKEIVEKYEMIIKKFKHERADFNTRIQQYFQEILTPGQINVFLTMVSGCDDHMPTKGTALILTKLIQNSYLNGHNGFSLNICDSPDCYCLGGYLAGTSENKIKIRLNGDLNNHAFHYSMHLQARLTGNARYGFADHAKDSSFEIAGNVYDSCGVNAKRISLFLHGNAGKSLGVYAKDSHFQVKGDTKEELGSSAVDCQFEIWGRAGEGFAKNAHNCTFTFHDHAPQQISPGSLGCHYKTDNRTTLNRLLSRDITGPRGTLWSSYGNPTGNKIIFIHPDGEEEVVKEYA